MKLKGSMMLDVGTGHSPTILELRDTGSASWTEGDAATWPEMHSDSVLTWQTALRVRKVIAEKTVEIVEMIGMISETRSWKISWQMASDTIPSPFFLLSTTSSFVAGLVVGLAA